jgi:hypothetical protein
MRRRVRGTAAAAVLAVLSLVGCGGPIEEAKHKATEPYSLEAYAGTGLSRVRLTAKAAERLAVATAAVEQIRTSGGTERKVIPYGAIIYDSKGDTWTYTSPEPLVYVRQSIVVDFIEGDRVYLTEGPNTGTPVVIMGAAELYGIEFGLGK